MATLAIIGIGTVIIGAVWVWFAWDEIGGLL